MAGLGFCWSGVGSGALPLEPRRGPVGAAGPPPVRPPSARAVLSRMKGRGTSGSSRGVRKSGALLVPRRGQRSQPVGADRDDAVGAGHRVDLVERGEAGEDPLLAALAPEIQARDGAGVAAALADQARDEGDHRRGGDAGVVGVGAQALLEHVEGAVVSEGHAARVVEAARGHGLGRRAIGLGVVAQDLAALGVGVVDGDEDVAGHLVRQHVVAEVQLVARDHVADAVGRHADQLARRQGGRVRVGS